MARSEAMHSGGDAQLTANQIELGPDARIQGRLRYRSPNAPKRAASAQIAGGIEDFGPRPASPNRDFSIAGLLLWSLGLGAVAALLLSVLPAFSKEVSATVRGVPGISLFIGFIALVCIPVALIIAMITVVGIPAGLLALLVYPVLLLLGYVSAGMALGDMALERVKSGQASAIGVRIFTAVVALLFLGLLAKIPVLGSLIGVLCMLAGMGALLLALWNRRKSPGQMA
jgi:hypothetical protein